MSQISKTKKLVGTAIFSALCFVVSLFEFSIFPSASFLMLDFSNVITLLGGFIYGPVSAVVISLVKELLCFAKSNSAGIGELANFIVTMSFVLLPTIVYVYKKGFKTVVVLISLGCVLQIAVSLLVNRFITFPLYMGESAETVFYSLWYFVLLFNLIKSVAVSIITVLLYKRTSRFIKKI